MYILSSSPVHLFFFLCTSFFPPLNHCFPHLHPSFSFRARPQNIYNVSLLPLPFSPLQKYAIEHTCKSAIWIKPIEKSEKKSRYKFADPEISRTFAPAFGNEAVMLDMMLQGSRFASCLPVSLRVSGPAFRKRGPSGRFPSSGWLSKKNFRKKTSQNIWQFENNSLPLHPLLRSEPRSRAPKKTSKKSSAKIWRICEKLLTFATAFLKNGSVTKERSLMRFT